ncbi:DUF1189 domain-containing protein [Fictibacillus nanhaiensis]|uniref:DUF1189 family protein n=1 Tax=Fictibacillus nanhaiensis TaxID=742169 RepID=UPI001C9881B8|nr:DUF1189 family protein [Fictibacillus nanhaiensis]MBY6035478.1 DUF1189 domain-containing protein [Fictibacillus nanhaiensis]
MNLHIRLLKSLYSTAAISHFRFLGVGSTILYILALAFLSMIPVVTLFVLNLNQRNTSMDNFQNYGLDPEQMKEFALSMEGILPIVLMVVYLAMYILLAGSLFSGISVLAGLGLPFSKILKKKLTYKHLWVMSCYSITLPVFLLTILFVLNVHLPFSFLLFWIVSSLILLLAIKHIPVKKIESGS